MTPYYENARFSGGPSLKFNRRFPGVENSNLLFVSQNFEVVVTLCFHSCSNNFFSSSFNIIDCITGLPTCSHLFFLFPDNGYSHFNIVWKDVISMNDIWCIFLFLYMCDYSLSSSLFLFLKDIKRNVCFWNKI